MSLVRRLAVACAASLLLAAPALAQLERDTVREYEPTNPGLTSPGDEKPGLPGAPGEDEDLRVPPVTPVDAPSPEVAQEMVLDIFDTYEWIFETFQMPKPAGVDHVALIETARAQLLLAPPEHLETFATNMGPYLPQLHQAVRVQASSLRAALEAKPDRGPVDGASSAKSAGFPSLRGDVPGYPLVDPSTGSYTASEGELEDEQAEIEEEDEEDDRSGVSRSGNALFCTVTISGGRASRKSADYLFNQRSLLLLADIINEIANDVCGGFSGGVSIFSAEYSCDICCILPDVLYELSLYFYDQQILCEDLIDSAETEATYLHSLRIFEGLEHIHQDVECHPTSPLVRGSGCNGKDDDCDFQVDECDEDAFGPLVHIDEAVTQPWYPSDAAAIAAVSRAVSVVDECRTFTVSTPSLSGPCGARTASVTVTDACGNSTNVSTVVKVDTAAPTVSISGAVADSCHATIDAAEAAVLAATTLTDDCTASGALDVRVDSTVTDCALRVRIEAIDLSGKRSVDAVTVRVDPSAPSISLDSTAMGFIGGAGAFRVPPCFATVADAEAAALSVTSVSDGCSLGIAPTVSSAGDPCNLTVTTSAVDECGTSSSDDTIVRVDATAPTVSCSVGTDELWPANHEMIDVGFASSASDDCVASPIVSVRVTSDERTAEADGAGGASPAPDAEILRAADGSIVGVRLRAERSSAGNGRVYAIHVEAVDSCGNVATSSCSVRVPSSRRGGMAIDDGQFYDATSVN